MPRLPEPVVITKRNDSKTFQFTINYDYSLDKSVCAEWRRRSFKDLPDELARFRYPKTKSEAKACVNALIAYLKEKQDGNKGVPITPTDGTTIEEFARDMFTDGAAHIKRWIEKGYELKPQTIGQHRRNLVNYLLPEFGGTPIKKVFPAKVEDSLVKKELSNSSRNAILYTLKLIMQEAKREGIIAMVPEFEFFKRASKRQDILSSEELDALFPDGESELIKIWKRPDGMRKERDEIALMFGTMFCIAVSAGMRSGEIRALHKDQVSFDNCGLVVDRAVDERGIIGLLKKATENDPRSRAVIIPGKSLKILERWMARAPKSPELPGLVFPYRNKMVSSWYILDRFRYGLDRLGIDHENRRLTVHCLRYTYNSRMRTKLPGDILREFLGHRSEAMTDHYDNPILLERLLALQNMRSNVEQFWDVPKIVDFKVS